jgi:hypothetical protein
MGEGRSTPAARVSLGISSSLVQTLCHRSTTLLNIYGFSFREALRRDPEETEPGKALVSGRRRIYEIYVHTSPRTDARRKDEPHECSGICVGGVGEKHRCAARPSFTALQVFASAKEKSGLGCTRTSTRTLNCAVESKSQVATQALEVTCL